MIASEPLPSAIHHPSTEEIQSPPPIFNYHNVKKAALILRALNHKLRQQILKIIADNKRLTVTELYVKLRLEQSVASQHLAVLRKTNIVITERDGKYIFYRINYPRISAINEFVYQLLAQA